MAASVTAFVSAFQQQEEGKEKERTQVPLPTRPTISNSFPGQLSPRFCSYVISWNEAAPGYKGVGKVELYLSPVLRPIRAEFCC